MASDEISINSQEVTCTGINAGTGTGTIPTVPILHTYRYGYLVNCFIVELETSRKSFTYFLYIYRESNKLMIGKKLNLQTLSLSLCPISQ